MEDTVERKMYIIHKKDLDYLFKCKRNYITILSKIKHLPHNQLAW